MALAMKFQRLMALAKKIYQRERERERERESEIDIDNHNGVSGF